MFVECQRNIFLRGHQSSVRHSLFRKVVTFFLKKIVYCLYFFHHYVYRWNQYNIIISKNNFAVNRFV